MTRGLALLLSLCLAIWSTSGDADHHCVQDQSGNGTQICTGDESPVTIVNGYTIEQHEAALARREAQIRADLGRVSSLEQDRLRRQIANIESQRANLQSSYDQAVRELTDLRNRLSDIGEGIPQQKIDQAKQALFEGDRSKADALFAQVEAMEQESIDRAAAAAFERGKIAEQEVRWNDAAKFYEKAATLVPDAQHLTKADEFLWRAGNARRAIRYAEDYLHLVIEEHGPESTLAARGYNELALKFGAIGEYDEAEPLYRQAIEIDKATIGETHPGYATHLNNLANLLRDTGRLDEAEPLYRQAIEIDKATIGETHPHYAIRLNNLAGLLEDTGRLDEAEQLYRQAMEITKATFGETHPNFAIHLNNLALMLRESGRLDEAEPLHRQAMEITKTALGETHPNYATRLNNLAKLLEATRRLDEAGPLYAEAVAILRASLGEDHPNTRTGAGNYAFFLRNHFPDDPALAELEATFGPDIGK